MKKIIVISLVLIVVAFVSYLSYKKYELNKKSKELFGVNYKEFSDSIKSDWKVKYNSAMQSYLRDFGSTFILSCDNKEKKKGIRTYKGKTYNCGAEITNNDNWQGSLYNASKEVGQTKTYNEIIQDAIDFSFEKDGFNPFNIDWAIKWWLPQYLDSKNVDFADIEVKNFIKQIFKK